MPMTDNGGVTRRSFIQTMGLSAAGAAIETSAGALTAEGDSPPIVGPGPIAITLRVNGEELPHTIDPATTLMEFLRWHTGLTGTKEVCDRGACGACSVLVDGMLVNSCMMLAIDAEGAEITTIEGVADGDKLDPIQTAFIKHDALQCGFCTPGLVIACKALLADTPKPSLKQIKQGLSGNLCRCGTYTNVFNAVLEASGQEPVRDSGAAP